MGNALSSAFRYCLALALALALVFALIGMARSHGPLGPSGTEVADLAISDAEAADHEHGGDGFSYASHSHGHNPADHTHETPTNIPVFSLPMPTVRQSWVRAPSISRVADSNVRLERPPRV
ncbi:hypothetical protein [Rhizobium sp. NPDC092017]|uniref:hypothetical protein n=1 Tax=Rhizobium sp. NPDC092017 TaxID=3364502 RepID=UPI0037FE6266